MQIQTMKNSGVTKFKLIMLSAMMSVVAFVQTTQAQTVIWSDNFDAPTGGANNNNGGVGWTLNSGGTGTNQWFIITPTSNLGCTSSGNQMHISCDGIICELFGNGPIDPLYNASGNNNRSAVSPNISTIGQNSLEFSFEFVCNGVANQDYGLLAFSSDGGTTWNEFPERYEGVSTCSTKVITVPGQYLNIPNFKVRFRWIESNAAAGFDPPFSVDNIRLTAPTSTCTPPTVSAGTAASICAGESVTIGGAPTATGGSPSNYVYTWTPATGLSSTSTANPVASPTQTTTYTVSVNGGDAACTATSTVTVTVNSSQTIAITPSGNQTICTGQSVGLSAAAGFTNYVWSTPSGNVTGQTVTASQGGSYSVSADGSGGCDATSTPVVITVDPPFNLSVTPAGPITLCAGETVTLVAQNGFSNYQWSNNEFGQSLEVGLSGGYSVSANNANGCPGASQIVNVTISPVPVAGFTYEQINDDYEVEFTNTSQNAVSYLWDFGAGNTSTLENPMFAFEFDNTWPVTLTVTNPCGSDTFTTGVVTIKTSIPEIEGLQLSMLPNPGKDQFILKGSATLANNFTLRVMNVQGQVLLQQQQKIAGTFLIPVDMSEFASGIYFVVLETSDGRNTLRWIKE